MTCNNAKMNIKSRKGYVIVDVSSLCFPYIMMVNQELSYNDAANIRICRHEATNLMIWIFIPKRK